MMESKENPREWESISDNAIVYRALLRKQWIDEATETVKYPAYLLRENEDGLSVNLASAVLPPEECAAKFRNCYGVASLKVGDIRQLGLDVVLDSRTHALIIGLPYREDNPFLAERLAYLLAKSSLIVWKP